MLKKNSMLACAAAILLCSSILTGANLYDPSYKWSTVKTNNFYIHFHDGNKSSALRAAEIAEKHYPRLTKNMKWKPWSRTHVILADSSDQANGWATPFPHNTIVIYLTRPYLDEELANFEDWLELVFIHEFTHILNLDTVTGIPLALRYAPGRYMFPNATLPIWALEGSAVHSESIFGGMGRNNSVYTDMILRTDISESAWKDISEGSVFPREWPRGSVPYLYGGAFVAWLEKYYGAGNFAEYFQENGDNLIPYSDSIYPIPYFYNKDAKDVYGKGFGELWKEWSASAKKKYEAQIESIKKGGITSARFVSDPEADSTMPVFSPDGKYLFYIESHPRKNRSLVRYSLEKKSAEKLCEVNRPSGLAPYGEKSALTADVEYYNSFSLFTELFIYDTAYTQTTKRLRGTHIDFSPRSGRMIAASINENRYSLTVYEKEGAPLELIKNSDIQITFPALSPDGNTALFIIKDTIGSDIALCDISLKKFTRLTNDRPNELHPRFTPDGKKIIFSSDRDGAFNIYEMNISDGAVRRVTNLIGGGFHPALSPDGRTIAFANYGKNGHTVSVMDYKPDEKISRSGKSSPLDPAIFISSIKPSHDESLKTYDYNPLNSLSPPFIIPIIFLAEYYPKKYEWGFGFSTMGNDALARHSYALSAAGYSETKRAVIEASYTYSRLRPDITIGYYDDSLFFGEDNFPVKGNYSMTRTMTRSGYAMLTFPWIKFNSLKFLSFYTAVEKQTDDYSAAYWLPAVRKENIDSAAGAAFYYDSTKLYPYSISPENGRSLILSAKRKHHEFDYSPAIYVLLSEYAEYLSAPGKSAVFMLRARGGYSIINRDYAEPFSLGRFEKGASGIPENSWGIRGYPAGAESAYRFASATAEYRLPVLQADAGFDIAPLMFRDLWINFFAEGGNLWESSFSTADTRLSAGAELNITFTVGYQANLTGYLGYARGFSKGGEDQIYFAVGTLFEGAFKNRKSAAAASIKNQFISN